MWKEGGIQLPKVFSTNRSSIMSAQACKESVDETVQQDELMVSHGSEVVELLMSSPVMGKMSWL